MLKTENRRGRYKGGTLTLRVRMSFDYLCPSAQSRNCCPSSVVREVGRRCFVSLHRERKGRGDRRQSFPFHCLYRSGRLWGVHIPQLVAGQAERS